MPIPFPKTLGIACFLTLTVCGRSHGEELKSSQDLPMQVRSIFVAKCSECHGRGLSRPKAGLYLHDLKQLASNREWVVPYEPEKSYVWTLLKNDDMPAKGANAGLLNDQEKEIVRAWIAAGAPVPSSPVAPPQGNPVQESPGMVSPAPEPQPASAPPSVAIRFLIGMGKFHQLVLHFPIALFAAAALIELFAAIRRSALPNPTVRFCVLLGAAGAVAAAALGWLHADIGGYGSDANGFLSWHRWLGTTAGFWAIGIALLSEWDCRRGKSSRLFRILLGSGAMLVAVTAHFGGLMVHGRGFFDW